MHAQTHKSTPRCFEVEKARSSVPCLHHSPSTRHTTHDRRKHTNRRGEKQICWNVHVQKQEVHLLKHHPCPHTLLPIIHSVFPFIVRPVSPIQSLSLHSVPGLRASQGPASRAECLKKWDGTRLAPAERRRPQASPAILTQLTAHQWQRCYLVHLAGDPLLAVAERWKPQWPTCLKCEIKISLKLTFGIKYQCVYLVQKSTLLTKSVLFF